MKTYLPNIRNNRLATVKFQGSPKRNFSILMMALTLIFFTSTISGQGIIPTKGKEFWVGFPKQPAVYTSSKRCELFITSVVNTNGIVIIPQQGWSLPFTVTANQTTSVLIPLLQAEHTTSEVIDNKGIQILTMDTVSLFAISFQDYSADATVIYPKQSLGTDYRIASYQGLAGYPSQFLIVATEDGTQVNITASATTLGGHAAGVPFMVNLDAGESYQVRAFSTTGDLTGSVIEATDSSGSCRPFAVFSGAECVNIPVGCTYCDVIYDQALPVMHWGKTYYSSPFDFATSYTLRILADQNATSYTVDGGPPLNLNAGQFAEINNIATAKCITANKPISVIQYMQGMSCAGAGDPAMMYLNAQEQKISEVTFSTVTSTVITQHNVNVILNTAHTGQLKLDGVPVPAGSFTTFPACSNISYAQLSLVQGSHTLTADSGFAAYAYGTGSAESYAYSVGSFSKSQPIQVDSVWCSNDTVNLGVSTQLFGSWWSTLTNPNDTLFVGNVLTLIPPLVPEIYLQHGNEYISGCEKIFYFAVEVPDPPQTLVTSNLTVTCQNNLVQLTASTIPASSIFNYSWSPVTGLSNPNIANPVLTATTSGWYYVTISSNNNCTPTVTDSIYIDVLPIPVPNVGSGNNQVICLGGSATLTATGGVAFNWMPGSFSTGTITVSPVVNTDYIVFVTDTNGCQNSDTVTVFVNPLPVANAGNDVAICDGTAATLSGSGGVSYLWNPGGFSTSSISVLPSSTTTYSLQVTDANGCQDTDSVLVTVSQPPVVFAGNDNAICVNGSISLTASGAANYTWNPGGISGGTITVSPAVTTNYIVTGTDVSGCTNTDTVTVFVNQIPAINLGPDQSVCIGNSVTLTATGGSTYLWNPGGFATSSIAVSPVVNTSYVVMVADSVGCTNSDTVLVTVIPLPVVNAGVNQTICAQDITSLAVIGGISWVWTPGGGTASTINVAPLVTTSYSVLATDANGCQNTDSVLVTVNQLPAVSAGNDNAICENGTITLNASGAISYTWNPGGGTGSAFTVSPVVATDYIVTGTDANGCINTDTVTVFVNQIPAVNIGPDQSVCTGNSVTLTVTGGSTYLWNPGGFTTGSISVSPLVNTSYIVIVADSVGCMNSDTVLVTVNPLPAVNAGNNQTICALDTASLTVTGGISWVWSPGGSTNSTISVTPAVTTNYSVMVTDANGCQNQDFVTVNVNPLPVANAGANTAICIGESAALTAGGGISYVWIPGGSTSGTISVAPVTTTNYIVNVTDINGCQNSDTVQVVVNPLPVVNAGIDQEICIGSSTALTATGGVSFLWTPGGSINNTVSVSPAVNTSYSVIVTDINGCSSSDTVSVTVNPLPVVDAGISQTMCYGSFVNLAASGGVSYIWNPGSIAGSAVSVSPPGSTYYVVSATDANGCVNTDSVMVFVNQLPLANAGSDQLICPAATTTLTATGGVSYLWNPGGTTGATISVSPAAPTSYIVLVTDANGCTNTDTANVSLHPLPVSAFGTSAPVCQNNSFTYYNTSSVSQGNLISFAWNFGDGNVSGVFQPDHIYSNAGNYPVTLIVVSDAGCADTLSQSVHVNTAPVVDFSASNQCVGIPVMFNDFSTAAPNQIISWNWDFGDGGTSNVPVPEHAYTTPGWFNVELTVISDSGCVASKNIPQTVLVYPLPEAGYTYSPSRISIMEPVVYFHDQSYLGVEWQWDFGDGIGESSLKNPVYVYSDTGSFAVRLIAKSNMGCLDTLFGEIHIDPYYTLYVPNAFTPNGDGVNDAFNASGIGILEFEMNIFDRWGESIFKTRNPEEAWDGTAKDGKLSMQGVYVYHLKVTDFNSTKREFSGTVNLIR